MSELKIEYVPLSQLKKHPRNPKAHRLDELNASVDRYGFTMPPAIDERSGLLCAGHGRIDLLTRMKAEGKAAPPGIEVDAAEWRVPVIRGLSFKDDSELDAYLIADNRLTELGGWLDDKLLEILKEQQAHGTLKGTGYDENELRRLLADQQRRGVMAGEDAIPELPKEPQSKSGDLFLLGKHRLVCGDSTNSVDVARVIGGYEPLLMVTDPPYGVNYDPAWRHDRGINQNKKKLGKVKNDDRADWRAAYELFPGNIMYVWSADLRSRQVVESIEACNFMCCAQIIWSKDRFTLGRGDYHFQHEPCWYAVRSGSPHAWLGGRSQSTIWQIKARDDDGHGHGTQKPVECMRRPILNHILEAESVYDPFLGSGTTILAAETTGRICLGVEIDPAYCDVIVERWETFTGKKAERIRANA